MDQPFLALDLGGKRIGVAVNPTGQVIIELPTIVRAHGEDIVPLVDALIEEYSVKAVIVGQSRVREAGFIRELMARLPVPVYPVDETLTTKEAERQLSAEGARGDSDARAARLILEQYVAEHPSRLVGRDEADRA
ncbi:Holliday junction resolvase RuvX [Candidatus Berkelbacteria bacterium]|nr:Holliday junction resolvase RuvX [Candidatus Berkelbacteria bacterium]